MAARRQYQVMKGKYASETRFWASFGVVVALLMQVFVPAHVMAIDRGGDTVFVMCTGQGLEAKPVIDQQLDGNFKDNGSKPKAVKCADCVLASLTAMAVQARTIEPVQYAPTAIVFTANHSLDLPKSRGPPRPHSCGPPSHI